MNYHFDKIIDRKGTSSVKWERNGEMFGTPDVIPMWVADMDFEVAPPIVKALKERVDKKVFGYTFEDDNYYQCIIDWIKNRHSWNTQKDWFSYSPGVVPGLAFAIQAFTLPGDKVIIQPPVYKPFFTIVENNHRQLLLNPLKQENGEYHFNKKALLEKIDEKTKMILLCNPHNPIGKVWKKEELEEIASICLEHNIIIVSDEIHSDIIYRNNKHIPVATLSKAISDITVTFSSPAKTFNLQGLQGAFSIIPNPRLREKYNEILARMGNIHNNSLSIEASKAAYGKCGNWVDELNQYLEGNRDYLKAFIDNEVPPLKLTNPQGSYIAWLDCNGLNMTSDELNSFFINEAGLGLINGTQFGEEGKGFMRINFACPRPVLEKAMKQLKVAVRNY